MIKLITKVYNWYLPFHKKMIHDNIFAIAAQTAFFILLSSVPFLMFLMSMLQTMNIPTDLIQTLLGSKRAGENFSSVTKSLTEMYSQPVSISIVSLIATLWSAAKGIHAIANGLNRVHNTYENRNWFVIRLRSMVYTLLFLVIILGTVAVIFLSTSLNNLIRENINTLPGSVEFLYGIRYLVMFIYQVFFFALLYRSIPNLKRQQRKEYGVRCQLPGALFTTLSWHVLLFAISIYVTDFNGFSVYKGLTQLAVIMVFTYFCMVCMMIGAEINVYFHKEIDWFTRWLSVKYFVNKIKKKKEKKKDSEAGGQSNS